MPNARLNERAPFFAEVDVLAAGTPTPRRVWGSDVSETGMFLQTTHPFRVGDRVSLRFDCEATPVHVRAAEVMWVRPFEPISVDGSMPGAGLKFVALDPPSRAALRKFVAPHLVDTTLPETAAAALDPLPPPVASLPPITGSILTKTEHKQIITDEMIAISLPPFSEPPVSAKHNKKHPAPAPITIGPRRLRSTPPLGSMPSPHAPPSSSPPAANGMPSVAVMSVVPTSMPPVVASLPPHPLAGWSFRKDDSDTDEAPIETNAPIELVVNDTVPIAAAAPMTRSPKGEEQPLGFHSTPPFHKLDLRFDDEAPASVGASLAPVSASNSGVFARTPSFTGSLPPDEARFFDMSSSPPSAPAATQVPDEDHIIAVEHAVVHGDLAIKHLPIAYERRASPSVSMKSRALPMAFVLLCSGTLIGVVVGTVMKRMKQHVPVALTQAPPPAPTLVPVAPAAVVAPATPVKDVAALEQELALASEAPKPAGPIVSAPPPVKDTMPRKASAADESATDATLASTKPRSEDKAEKKKAKAGDRLTLDVNVGSGARLVKAFTLASPSRIVVDLAGAKLPKAPLLNPADGVARVRFGSPAPGTGRVVVELDRDGKAYGVETWVSRGALTVTFK